MAETKPKQANSLRTPKPKKVLGLTVPPALRLPHDDLISPKSELTIKDNDQHTSHTSQASMTSMTSHTATSNDKSFQEAILLQQIAPQRSTHDPELIINDTSLTSQTSMTTMPSLTSMPAPTSPTSQTADRALFEQYKSSIQSSEFPVSPQRDFTKFANSINREAVPGGLFTGKSKQLYDCLYSLTRGAIVPKRTIRISRPKLMKQAHIGSRVTFDANVERLVSVGLISVRQIIGEHDGNEYMVFLPEEVTFSDSSLPSPTSQTSLTDSAQNLDRLVGLETSQTRHSLSSIESDISAASKTSFKTKDDQNDDESFDRFTRALKKAVVEITGREPSESEATRWEELADVLVTELKIAAGRTTVSSVPAFLAEHLRRRLWKKEKRQIDAEAVEQQPSQKAQVDASKCPDCFGAGMYYPEGFEKGVARCAHKNLTPEPEG